MDMEYLSGIMETLMKEKWINGKMHGNGKYKYNNGIIYEGKYSNGTKNGHGKLIYPDGNVFEGVFVNGVIQGKSNSMNNNNKNKVETLKMNQI